METGPTSAASSSPTVNSALSRYRSEIAARRTRGEDVFTMGELEEAVRSGLPLSPAMRRATWEMDRDSRQLSAKILGESARIDAELARIHAESARVHAELARIHADSARIHAQFKEMAALCAKIVAPVEQMSALWAKILAHPTTPFYRLCSEGKVDEAIAYAMTRLEGLPSDPDDRDAAWEIVRRAVRAPRKDRGFNRALAFAIFDYLSTRVRLELRRESGRRMTHPGWRRRVLGEGFVRARVPTASLADPTDLEGEVELGETLHERLPGHQAPSDVADGAIKRVILERHLRVAILKTPLKARSQVRLLTQMLRCLQNDEPLEWVLALEPQGRTESARRQVRSRVLRRLKLVAGGRQT